MAEMRAPGERLSADPELGIGGTCEVVHLERRTLLQRHLQGDKLAFAELLTHYRAPVFSYIVRAGVDPKARDDVFQEIFLKVHQSAASYQPERPFEPWLFTITANSVRSYYRREQVRKKVFATEVGAVNIDHTPSGKPSGESITEAKQTSEWLDLQLCKLPLGQKEAVILCCIEQIAQKDAAEALGIPLATLKTNLRRARVELALALTRRNSIAEREAKL